MTVNSASEGLRAQDELIAKLEAEGAWNIIVGDAFVRGMRDIGYKSMSYAVAELVDNAVQAAASRIDLVFGFDSGAKPTQIAVIDDGYGMKPQMVRASLMWGAGTRSGDRLGYGKYGYGLPSASVSQCQRVAVYSKTEGGDWYSCHLDVDEISSGKWANGNQLEMPKEKAEQPPRFVIDYLKKAKHWDGFAHGTVVVWTKLDRIGPKLREALRDSFVSNLGVIYRNVLVNVPMTVDDLQVQPCDPLFLTPGFRGYDTDDDRAVGMPPAVVDVKEKDSGKVLGHLRVRFARMPSTFFRLPEAKHTNRPGRKGTNERLEIADANNGIIFTRNGRQIDVIRPPRSIGSINVTTDRFWAVEVDFDATLDELFAITTSKQQVRPDDKIWDILNTKANLFTAIGTMRGIYDREAKALAVKADADKAEKRASIVAIETAEKFRTTKTPEATPERAKEAEDNLKQEARRRAETAGVKPEAVERELVAQQIGNARGVQTEDMPGAPFYRCVQMGGQKVLYLNVAHPFYTELYASAGATPRLRAGLEILLWALGEAEVEAGPGTDRRQFYEIERSAVWSPYVARALPQLKGLPLMEADEPDADESARDQPAA